MKENDKKREDSIPTPNISVHYYTDPIYSLNGIYGYDDIDEEAIKPEKENLDEPVESWGWINNVD